MAYARTTSIKRRLERAADSIKDAEQLARDLGPLGIEGSKIRLAMLDRLRAAVLDIQLGAEDIYEAPIRKRDLKQDAALAEAAAAIAQNRAA